MRWSGYSYRDIDIDSFTNCTLVYIYIYLHTIPAFAMLILCCSCRSTKGYRSAFLVREFRDMHGIQDLIYLICIKGYYVKVVTKSLKDGFYCSNYRDWLPIKSRAQMCKWRKGWGCGVCYLVIIPTVLKHPFVANQFACFTPTEQDSWSHMLKTAMN